MQASPNNADTRSSTVHFASLFLAMGLPLCAQQMSVSQCPTFLGAPQLSANCILSATDLAFDAQGNGWIADSAGRVLRFPGLTNTQLPAVGVVADVVIGKRDFTAAQNIGSCSACNLNSPDRLQFDNHGALWLIDSQQVLRFSPPFKNGQAADLAVPLSATGGLRFDANGNLWVAGGQGGCDRVLQFSPPFSSTMLPKVVLGQPDFNTCLSPAPGANRVNNIRGIALDGAGNLYVGDNGSNRIAVFNAPFKNFMNASAVIGQNDLTSFNPLQFDQGGMAAISDLTFDSAGNLWVVHNYYFVSVYSAPFATGEARAFWFDFIDGIASLGKFPFQFNARYQYIRFTSDWSLWFSNGCCTTSSESLLARITPPVVSPLGVVSAASLSWGPVAPGQFVTIFGVQLGFPGSGLIASAPGGQIGTGLGETQVFVNGQAVPIYFANSNQVNLLLPYTLDITAPTQFQVSVAGLGGPPVSLPALSVNPGIFLLPGNTPAIINDQYLVGPLKRGGFGVAFATGLGTVNGSIQAGAVAPLTPLFSTLNPVEVDINNQPCTTFFAGLAPGAVGEYQINFGIPADLPAATSYQLLIKQLNVTSKPVSITVN